MTRWSSARRRSAASVALALLLGGCAMARLERDLGQLGRLALVAGPVEAAPSAGEIYVALVRDEPGAARVVDVTPLAPAIRQYAFAVESGAPWRVAAFADSDGDGAWDEGEPAGQASESPLVLAAEERRVDLAIRLSAGARLPAGWDWSVRAASGEARLPIVAGEIATLDDERFSPDSASSGMWQPVRSSLERGLGIFFLEPYDPRRVPVLFVHGIGGSPRDFRETIAALDRERFQPWVFSYPSGIRLERAATGLARLIEGLVQAHAVPRLVITAHSMGGLVARGAVLKLAERGRAGVVAELVTFATPWNGHRAAEQGVKYAPATVPSWIDMQPDSDYLRWVRTPLPAALPFHLLFGYDTGRYRPLMPYSNDSVVAVASQLAGWAQEEARAVWGFDADHVAILASPEALARWRRLLDAALAPGVAAAPAAPR